LILLKLDSAFLLRQNNASSSPQNDASASCARSLISIYSAYSEIIHALLETVCGSFAKTVREEEMNKRTTSVNGSYGSCDSGGERRYKMRVYDSFALKVQGTDPKGRLFEIDAVSENLSASGLYMQIARQVEKGDKLLIRIKFPPVLDDSAPGLDVAARGEVRRIVPLDNNDFGVAVCFTRHHVL
jgi:hypothetical protein